MDVSGSVAAKVRIIRSAFLFSWKNLPTIDTENGERLKGRGDGGAVFVNDIAFHIITPIRACAGALLIIFAWTKIRGDRRVKEEGRSFDLTVRDTGGEGRVDEGVKREDAHTCDRWKPPSVKYPRLYIDRGPGLIRRT